MAEYLTETAYQRWLRQYQTNLGFYINILDQLRIRLDALPYEEEVRKIESVVNEIDENLEKAIPRNFNANGEALVGFDMFVENMKVLINLIYRMSGHGDHFTGIYQSEKSRVSAIHQEFQFKEKLKKLHEMIETAEAKKAQEMAEMTQTVSPSTPLVVETGS